MSHHHHNHHRSVIAVLSLSVTAFLLMASPSLAQQADQLLSAQHIAK